MTGAGASPEGARAAWGSVRPSASAVTHGNQTSAYDRNGSFAGTAIRNSNGTTSFYNGRGTFVGSSVRTGPRR